MIVTNTNSTAWHEHPGQPSPGTGGAASGLLSKHPSEIARQEPVLLAELEASLIASHQALLTRDLNRLERLTADQRRLGQSLSLLYADANHSTVGTSDLSVPAARERVLHLGRVQKILLLRARNSVRVLFNVLNGPQAAYRPVSGCCAVAEPYLQPFSPQRSKEV